MFTGIFEHCELINEFVRVAKNYGYHQVIDRYDKAVEKLGDMCLRYTEKMLKHNEIKITKRYLKLAPVLKEDVGKESEYLKILELCKMDYNEFLVEIR